MFKATNPYDEVVTKATDENLTSENWQLNLDVCDKVTTEGSSGARNCVAAILKRLVHRNANVQLYSLTLSDALSKNCGEIAHQELASKSYTQTLQRIVTDRNTHDIVKKKCLSVIKEWNSEWGNDESLGLIRETMEALRKQGFSAKNEQEAAPVEPNSDQLRAEDEELRRVLELSLQDQGGRAGAGFVSSQPGVGSSNAPATSTSSQPAYAASTGYMPLNDIDKALPDPSRQSSGNATTRATYAPQPSSSTSSYSAPTLAAVASPAPAPPAAAASQPIASRVRALFDFTPTESGELAFRKGDVLRVLDSVYEHWWRGEVNGEVGIFPVNFVEVLPDPTPADVQREAEMEAKIFAQANNIDRLLSKLRGLDPARDNLAEDEELQDLYQSSLSMRPKIVKLIDRYNLKVSELRSMNEKFVRARSTFDAMMEQSLAKYNPSAHREDYTSARPDYGQYPAQQHQRSSQNGGIYQQQQPPQHSPAISQHSSYQVQPPGSGDYSLQHQEYAQAWAAWYDQNGYPQPSPGQTGGLPVQQTPPGVVGRGPSGPPPPSSVPPNVNDPGYAQWYYAQQQQQPQQPQQTQQYYQQYQQPTIAAPSSSSSSSTPAKAPSSSGYDYRQGQQPAANESDPHDQDKRVIFERARAEAEAYQRAHQQHSSSSADLPLQ